MTAAPAGEKVAADAFSVAPTRGVPLTTGASVVVSVRSLKWMKPLGQEPPPLMIRAQVKSPPHQSIETMISVGDTTRSM